MIRELASDWFGRSILAAFALCIFAVVGIFVAVWYDGYSHRNDICVRSHVETIYVKSGNVLIPVEDTVCDQWVPKDSR